MDALPPLALHEFRAHEGRLALCLRLVAQGADLHAFLLGGEDHVGAVALAAPGEAPCVCERPGHREGELAGLVARRLSQGLGCAVSVSSGIHFAAISRAEISAVENMAMRLVEECLSSLAGRRDGPC